MHHCAVGGCSWGDQGDEHHHADGHADRGGWYVGILISKGQDDRHEDNGHAGVVGKVGGDQSKGQKDQDENDVRFAAQEWLQDLGPKIA